MEHFEAVLAGLRSPAFREELPPESGAVYDEHRGRVLRWLTRRLGLAVVQRPVQKIGFDGKLRPSRDIDFYVGNFLCGVVCCSRNNPDDKEVFSRGWYLDGGKISDLQSGLYSHQYACVVYSFGNGDIYWTNLVSVVAGYSVGRMESSSSSSAGIYMKPSIFIYLGNLTNQVGE